MAVKVAVEAIMAERGDVDESEKQDTEAQNQQNADNTAKPTFVTNPKVKGNNNNKIDFSAVTINNDSNSFLSELISN